MPASKLPAEAPPRRRPRAAAPAATPAPAQRVPEPQRGERAQPDKPRVQSAARAVAILVAVARSERGLQAKEIAQSLALPRQVTYHLLHTLTGEGMLRKDASGRYVAGLAMASLAEGFRRQLGAPEQFAPVVRDVALETGETAYASGWLNNEIVVFTSVRGNSAVHAAEVPHGFSGHAHARASGKLLLALAPPLDCVAYLRDHRFTRLTANTITSASRLRAALETIRAQGYATDEEEFTEGLSCVAVPFAVSDAFVLGISAPTERFRARFDEYLQMLRRHAARHA